MHIFVQIHTSCTYMYIDIHQQQIRPVVRHGIHTEYKQARWCSLTYCLTLLCHSMHTQVVRLRIHTEYKHARWCSRTYCLGILSDSMHTRAVSHRICKEYQPACWCSLIYCLKVVSHGRHTGWWRPIGCLVFTGHFPPKRPTISGSFAKNDLQLKVSYGSWPLCTRVVINRMHTTYQPARWCSLTNCLKVMGCGRHTLIFIHGIHTEYPAARWCSLTHLS